MSIDDQGARKVEFKQQSPEAIRGATEATKKRERKEEWASRWAKMKKGVKTGAQRISAADKAAAEKATVQGAKTIKEQDPIERGWAKLIDSLTLRRSKKVG